MEKLPSFLWGEAMSTTIYTLNSCPTKSIEGKPPYEAWTEKNPTSFISKFLVVMLMPLLF